MRQLPRYVLVPDTTLVMSLFDADFNDATVVTGPVGTKVLIWGSNLLSAAVSFNGVPATAVTNSDSNYATATVPTGATTGPITVTTPGGTYTTKASFTVE